MGVGEPASHSGWGRQGGTLAEQQLTVVAVTCGALTEEAPNLVDTDAPGTDGGDLPALIDIWEVHQHQGQPSLGEHLGTLS